MLLEGANAGRRLRAIGETTPIASAVLWDQPLPRTSQRRAANDMGLTLTIDCGGNRAGKSDLGAMLSVCVASGYDDPAVRAFELANRLDLSWIQPGPGRVWCSALTFPDSVEYMRPALDRYLPAGTKRRTWNVPGPATAELPGGGVLVMKCADQKRKGFQGGAVHGLWLDEEHDQDVWKEASMRLVDHSGRAWMTMTPLKGHTWVYNEFIETTPNDVRVHYLHGHDNPHIPNEALDRLLSRFGDHERSARAKGSWVTLEGRVYPDFQRPMHVVPSFRPPDEWLRYGGIDFGTRNPFCSLWFAMDPSDDYLHLYREHYQADWTISEHAQHIIAQETCSFCHGTEKFEGKPCEACAEHPGRCEPDLEWRVADPANRGDRITLAREWDLPTRAARKDVSAQINTVAGLLKPDASGKPHLIVHDNCVNVIREFENYVWDTLRTTKFDQPDRPKKRNDHAMDVVAYVCHMLQREDFGAA